MNADARARARPSAAVGLTIALVIGAAAVGLLRPALLGTYGKVQAREDVYVLPPPEELTRATLGYRAAAADMIWAQLLVDYGRHWAEKRAFSDMEKYIDAIIALDPSFPALYRFVDTLLVFRPPIGTEADARKARAYLERGLRERPYDRDVWLQYGQFVAFLAPSFLTNEEEKERWRIDGAEAIVRATELGAIVDRAISATSVLSRAGRRAAALDYLQRAQALTQDPAQAAEIEARLAKLERELTSAEQVEPPERKLAREKRQARTRLVDGRWRKDFPFVSRGEYLLLGPVAPPYACAGAGRYARPECAGDWESALSAAVR